MVSRETRIDYYKAWLTLVSSARTVYKVSERNMAGVGLSPTEFQVLRTLVESGPCPMVDIANEQFITQAGVTSIVDNLERQGLVDRVRSKKDRRVINVEITGKGEKLFAEVHALSKQFFDRVMAALTRQEIDIILSAFDKLSKRAQIYPIENNNPARTGRGNVRKLQNKSPYIRIGTYRKNVA